MNCNRLLNVSVILILSLIYQCVFLFDFNRENDLLFLNGKNESRYYNVIELGSSIHNPRIPIDDIRDVYDSFTLVSRISVDDSVIYYVYDNNGFDYSDIFLKYDSFSADDYCFLGYDPFNSDQLSYVTDKKSIKDNKFDIDGLISLPWYDDSVTFYVDYDKWIGINGESDLAYIEFFSKDRLTDSDLHYIEKCFADYEIIDHSFAKDIKTEEKSISIGYFILFEIFLPGLVFLFSLSLIISYLDSQNKRKQTEHILGRPLIRILVGELFRFILMAVGGALIGSLILFGLFHLDFVSIFIDRIEIKETAVNSVIIYFVLVILFGTIASLKSMNKWRYSK